VTEKSLGVDVLPGSRLRVKPVGDHLDAKLRWNSPTEGNSMYNAVCLEVQNGNAGLGCVRS
jgi:hypothetical protein